MFAFADGGPLGFSETSFVQKAPMLQPALRRARAYAPVLLGVRGSRSESVVLACDFEKLRGLCTDLRSKGVAAQSLAMCPNPAQPAQPDRLARSRLALIGGPRC